MIIEFTSLIGSIVCQLPVGVKVNYGIGTAVGALTTTTVATEDPAKHLGRAYAFQILCMIAFAGFIRTHGVLIRMVKGHAGPRALLQVLRLSMLVALLGRTYFSNGSMVTMMVKSETGIAKQTRRKKLMKITLALTCLGLVAVDQIWIRKLATAVF